MINKERPKLKVVYSTKKNSSYSSFGAYLYSEWLEPLSLTPFYVAKEIKIKEEEIIAILYQGKKLSEINGWKLSLFFQMEPSFFLKKQCEIESEKKKNEISLIKEKIIPFKYLELEKE